MGIVIKDLSIRFRNATTAVNHVNMKMEKGIYGLLGENGAGKTTLMRALATVLKPSSGKIFLDNLEYCDKNYQEIQSKIGYLPQELGLYPNLTVRETLEYMAELSGMSKKNSKEQIDVLLENTSLVNHQKKKNRQLSGGMKRRVGLIQALLNNPEFLIVDEPTTGLDPEERIRIRNLIVDFSKDRTVLFSTHVVEDLTATCNKLTIMKYGEFIYDGYIRDLMNKARGHIWICNVKNEDMARLQEKYYISSKQLTENGMQLKIISEEQPDINCKLAEVTLEDAYMYISYLRV